MKNNHMGTGLELRQVFLLQVMLMMAVGGIARAQGTQTYESEAFGVGNWSLQGAYSSPVAGATGSFEARSGDGNPDDYARIVVQMPSNPECPIGAYAVALNSSAVYDPAVLGPIQSIDYSWDMRISPDEPEFTVGSLALIQNGFLYAAFDARLNTGAPPSPWQNYAINGLTEADFGSYGGWNQAGQPARPDFSESGAPITFGHVVGTSRGFGSFDGLCANPPPAGSDLDNWEVVVSSGPPPAAGVFAFEEPSYTFPESAGAVTATVLRSGGSTGAANVDYDTIDVTATGDADYEIGSGTISFLDGETEKTVSLNILDDSVLEPVETFDLVLSNPTGGAVLGNPATAEISIADDETGADLAVFLSAEAPRYQLTGAGRSILVDYIVQVDNNGPDLATGVRVITNFPPGELTFEGVDPRTGSAYDPDTGIWGVGEMAAGTTEYMTLTTRKVDSSTGGPVTLSVRVDGDLDDNNAANNEASETVAAGGADLSVWIEETGRPDATTFEYTVEVDYSSINEEPARNVVLTLSAPGSFGASLEVQEFCSGASAPPDALREYVCEFAEVTQLISLTFTIGYTSGPKVVDVTAEVTSDTFDPDPADNFLATQSSVPAVSTEGSSSPCFIATAAWGSAWEPNVVLLREFRDNWLVTNAPGRWFVATYYRLSPPIADWIREREWARAMTRWALTPLVTAIRHPVGTAALLFLGIALVIGRRRRRAGKETFRTFVPFFPDRPSS